MTSNFWWDSPYAAAIAVAQLVNLMGCELHDAERRISEASVNAAARLILKPREAISIVDLVGHAQFSPIVERLSMARPVQSEPMSDAQRIIGACIRFFRERARLSQEQLAANADISYQYLSGIETGKENFTVQVLQQISSALSLPLRVLVSIAYDNAAGNRPPTVEPKFLRRQVPLPDGLLYEHLEATLNATQSVVHRLNRNLLAEGSKTLQDLIQHNNFSGLVSNLLSDSFDAHSLYKHNHDQKYPDLICPGANRGKGAGLEIKTTLKIGKGGESHNGHDGWHMIACYNFLENGDIRFMHVMFAQLNGHTHAQPDWSYVGSRVNADSGSRRTETYITNGFGATKLRDGSAYLDADKVAWSRWRQSRRDGVVVPPYSIWAPVKAARRPR